MADRKHSPLLDKLNAHVRVKTVCGTLPQLNLCPFNYLAQRHIN